MEDFVVHRNLASPQLNGGFSHFPDSLHRQRACECKGDCNGKKKSGPDQSTRQDKRRKKLTESEERAEGDDEGRALHAERVEIERREGK